MTKRLVIIPARGGSNRIKYKNLKKLINKPLINYALDSVVKSKIFSKIHISSDNKKILNHVTRLGIKNDFKRPKNLSNDTVGLWPVLNFVVKKYYKMKLHFDEVWLVYATNPFITSNIIHKCKKIFKKNSSKYPVLTVSSFNYPVEWSHEINKKGILKPFLKLGKKKRSQDLAKKYCDAGMVAVFPVNFFFKKKIKFNYIPLILPKYQTVDIDDIEDFKLAEKLFKKK